ncbi:glycosyltransferase family 4 protein [Hahella sp. HN01]|uniref:glycosyltransferase family 4 protein n=1 Tax=Hahella sp. HN01 TaxID=2847262 RepID=UPI001C1E939A|nr:glycosyltransferase family 4 protein [Hahella sp. HN01]MBU6955394.1 glycosyltransferase family 4 protein [Hahella sp. HN01]
MRTMRLLYLTPGLFPARRVDVGLLFGDCLPRHGVYSDIVAFRKPGAQEQEEAWGGGEAILADPPRRLKHLAVFMHMFKALAQSRRDRHDGVQVRDMPFIALMALILARLKGMPFLYWCSYPYPEGQIDRARRATGLKKLASLPLLLRGLLGRFVLYRLVLSRADHIFVQSERMKRDMADRGAPAERMTPVPMGVDLERMQASVTAFDADATDDVSVDKRMRGRRALIYLGSLDYVRNIETLFEMASLLRWRLPNIVLLIVGDTHDQQHKAWLQERARQLGVDDILIWTGWLPIQEAWRYIRQAEVGLSPIPRGELLDCSSPTKLIEYMALGVPVVCNDNPDQQMVIEQSGAGLCVPYTAEDFANAAETLLKEAPEMRRQRMENAIRYLRTHRDYPVIARKLAGTYFAIHEKACHEALKQGS